MLRDTWQIAKKDLLEFRRDHMRLVTFVIMPIFMMILTGFIFPSQGSLKDIPIGVVNLDRGSIGAGLVTATQNVSTGGAKAFKVKLYPDEDALKTAIQNQTASGGMVIPAALSQAVAANQQAAVTVVQDQSNPQISALTTQALGGLVDGFSKQVGAQKVSVMLLKAASLATPPPSLRTTPQPTPKTATAPSATTPATTIPASKTAATVSPAAIISPITAKISSFTGGDSNYFEFVAPGIMAMVVMTAVLTGLAGAVSREKEQGTLDGILIAPISRLAIILGKATAQAVRGLAQGAVVLLLAVFLFGVTIHGSILLVALLLFLGIFSFVGLGILVSAGATEQETATQILFMFQFPMLFLSGAFFPLQQMPKLMQDIAHLLPLTYAVEALRKIVILGAGLSAVRNEVLILTIFGAVTLAISVPLFKRMVTR